MSADNAILIAQFPDGYRVIHCQASENCDDSEAYPSYVTDCYRVLYFADAPLFTNVDDARKCAFDFEEQYEYVEYGICSVDYDRPLLSMSEKEASDKLDEYFTNLNKNKEVIQSISSARYYSVILSAEFKCTCGGKIKYINSVWPNESKAQCDNCDWLYVV